MADGQAGAVSRRSIMTSPPVLVMLTLCAGALAALAWALLVALSESSRVDALTRDARAMDQAHRRAVAAVRSETSRHRSGVRSLTAVYAVVAEDEAEIDALLAAIAAEHALKGGPPPRTPPRPVEPEVWKKAWDNYRARLAAIHDELKKRPVRPRL